MNVDTVIQGDCLEVMKGMGNESVDLVVTDPPFGINYLSGRYKDGNPFGKIANDDVDIISKCIDDLWRIVKPTGAIFIFYSYKRPFYDIRIKNVIIWVKDIWTAGDLEGDFGNQYESIAFMPKPLFKLSGYRYSNIWTFVKVPHGLLLHPTQKPITVIERIIRSSSNEGDLVLDPFLGSGTTAVACIRTKRHYIGIELNQEYCDIANKRIYEELQQPMLL